MHRHRNCHYKKIIWLSFIWTHYLSRAIFQMLKWLLGKDCLESPTPTSTSCDMTVPRKGQFWYLRRKDKWVTNHLGTCCKPDISKCRPPHTTTRGFDPQKLLAGNRGELSTLFTPTKPTWARRNLWNSMIGTKLEGEKSVTPTHKNRNSAQAVSFDNGNGAYRGWKRNAVSRRGSRVNSF